MDPTNESVSIFDQIEVHSGEVVLRDIDFFRGSQFWLFPGTAAELESWWQAQNTFDCNPDGALDALYQAFGETLPPHSTRDLPGVFLDVDSEKIVELWMAMGESTQHYFCTICCDLDSYLRKPQRTLFIPQGISGGA